ncbi:hypothetical protein RZ532_03285 [Nitratireductor aquimarinus]|uniref:hypothetical protein n=1 Tax=Nitratireductor aquimarinus TaxID=889300 RepID=UPI002935D7F5|nr:hypothetical protein [Nitratireductor aquimarinus]MDV2964983.1 hypothetical protein [Nitratireductor aquimarinus]
MIIYNVERSWFPMKNDAEKYRKELGLKPDALHKLTINDRDELAALLNGLVALKREELPAGAVTEPQVAPAKVVNQNIIEVPDYIPHFLAEAQAKKEGKQISWVSSESSPGS